MVSACSETLEVQVGQETLHLTGGDSLLINGNVLHTMRQAEGDAPDAMPNIVFSGTLIAPENSVIYQKYLLSVMSDDALPFILFKKGEGWHRDVNDALSEVYRQLRERGPCYEMTVQRSLSGIFEMLYLHFDELPRVTETRVQIAAQVRI